MENNEQPQPVPSEIAEHVQEIVNKLATESVESVIAAAQATKNDAIVDEVQRVLAENRDALRAEKKIIPTP